MITFGSLFAGVGGVDLGFERAAMTCKWQVEIDDYATRVLEKHWPDVRRWRDVRDFPPEPADDWRVDVICGGFPCQDISSAGKKVGIDGERSGLWSEYARIIRVLRPRVVVVENVTDLLVRGIYRVLGDLATLGFNAEWEVLSACTFGAPHTRERLFIIADNDGSFCRTSWKNPHQRPSARLSLGSGGEARRACPWWSTEPSVDSMVYGVSGIVDRLRPYGNAVVPQVAEYVGRRIVAALEQAP